MTTYEVEYNRAGLDTSIETVEAEEFEVTDGWLLFYVKDGLSKEYRTVAGYRDPISFRERPPVAKPDTGITGRGLLSSGAGSVYYQVNGGGSDVA